MNPVTFADLGVRAKTIAALAKRGINEPFRIQELLLPDALAARDVLGKSQTGSGKTLAFGISIVQRVKRDDGTPSALVLVPTRELASQVAEEIDDIARANDLRVAVAYGGVSLGDQARKAARSHILIATPGRLEDLASRKLVHLDKVKIFVLDEADRMLDMGFQPQVDRIVRRLKGPRQTMFFSATLDGTVGHMAASYTKDAVRHEVESPKQTVEEVQHFFKPVTSETKLQALVDLLRDDRELVLVFVRTRRGAERLARRLRGHGIRVAELHGDMTQSARERSWARFESGKDNVLVATDVAARGLDLNDISHVINFDPPEDEKAYVHRVGRTARAGRRGAGVTLVMPDQRHEVGRIASRLKLHQEFEAGGMRVPAPALAYSSSRGRRGPSRRRARRGL
jgi:ATP-dependent RNA helicase RhlE